MRTDRVKTGNVVTNLLELWVESGSLSDLINLQQQICNITRYEQDRLRPLYSSNVYSTKKDKHET